MLCTWSLKFRFSRAVLPIFPGNGQARALTLVKSAGVATAGHRAQDRRPGNRRRGSERRMQTEVEWLCIMEVSLGVSRFCACTLGCELFASGVTENWPVAFCSNTFPMKLWWCCRGPCSLQVSSLPQECLARKQQKQAFVASRLVDGFTKLVCVLVNFMTVTVA